MTNFRGVFPALITPFSQNGRINEKALEELVKYNLSLGVDGFYVGGSTAEAFLLSMDERKYILDIVSQTAKGACTIIYHVGCIGSDHAIKLAKHAEALGVDAVSSVPPFYYKFSFEEIKSYYEDIVNSVNLPMIIYNFPALSGVSLTSDNVKVLAQDKRFIGIKHTSMDLFQLQRMKQADSRLIVYNGHDEVFLASLAMGSDGAIGSTYNFMANKFIEIRNLFLNNKKDEAMELQAQVNKVVSVLIKVGVFQGIRHILEIMGIDCGNCRKPFAILSEEQKNELDKVYSDILA